MDELEDLATFLEDGYFSGNKSQEQLNLIVELTIMKMNKLVEEHNDQ